MLGWHMAAKVTPGLTEGSGPIPLWPILGPVERGREGASLACSGAGETRQLSIGWGWASLEPSLSPSWLQLLTQGPVWPWQHRWGPALWPQTWPRRGWHGRGSRARNCPTRRAAAPSVTRARLLTYQKENSRSHVYSRMWDSAAASCSQL